MGRINIAFCEWFKESRRIIPLLLLLTAPGFCIIPVEVKIEFETNATLVHSSNPMQAGVTMAFDLQKQFYNPIKSNEFVEADMITLDEVFIVIEDNSRTVIGNNANLTVSLGKFTVLPLNGATPSELVLLAPGTNVRPQLVSSVGMSNTNTAVGAGFATLVQGIKDKSYVDDNGTTTGDTPENDDKSLVRFMLFLNFTDTSNPNQTLENLGLGTIDIKLVLKATIATSITEIVN